MSVVFVLITFSLIVALVFLGFFIWAVRSGQYEDKYTPSVRMLFDDEKPVTEKRPNDAPALPADASQTQQPTTNDDMRHIENHEQRST